MGSPAEKTGMMRAADDKAKTEKLRWSEGISGRLESRLAGELLFFEELDHLRTGHEKRSGGIFNVFFAEGW